MAACGGGVFPNPVWKLGLDTATVDGVEVGVLPKGVEEGFVVPKGVEEGFDVPKGEEEGFVVPKGVEVVGFVGPKPENPPNPVGVVAAEVVGGAILVPKAAG